MEKGLLIVIVVLLILIGLGLVSISMLSTVKILPRISNTTSHMDNMNTIQHNSHYIRDVYFYEDPINKTDICGSITTKQIIILKAILNTEKEKEYCILEVDDRFEKQIVPYYPPCTSNCNQELELIIDIEKKDIYSSHTFELCCNEMCVKKTLSPLCI